MQPTSQEAYLDGSAVKPRESQAEQSSNAARAEDRASDPTGTLMAQVVQRDNLFAALRRVESNKGAPGPDGITVKQLREHLKAVWPAIRAELLAGTYKPQPVRRAEIPKPDGTMRMLGIPNVIDRLIQQALLQVLTPIFDPSFSDSSFGFRPNRSAHDAVRRARDYINEGYKWVVDMDLSKFFDRVHHDKLMARVARKVKDKHVLRLIREYLKAGIMLNGIAVRSDEGTPQGGPLSPLLANIMLDDLDKTLEGRGLRFCRYADDCNIYVASQRAGERVMNAVRRFVEGRLSLKVNEQKSAVDLPWNRKFLGFRFVGFGKVRIGIAPKSLERYKERIREITDSGRGCSIEDRIEALNVYLRGWYGYFSLSGLSPRTWDDMDATTRRRLRLCIWKQWKRGTTKLRNLIRLSKPGSNARRWARRIAYSRLGAWAITPSLQSYMDRKYFVSLGFVGLSDLAKA